jgi:hypothetical protein
MSILSHKRIPKFSKRDQLQVLLSALSRSRIDREEFWRRMKAAGLGEVDIDLYCQTGVLNRQHAEALAAYAKGGSH